MPTHMAAAHGPNSAEYRRRYEELDPENNAKNKKRANSKKKRRRPQNKKRAKKNYSLPTKLS